MNNLNDNFDKVKKNVEKDADTSGIDVSSIKDKAYDFGSNIKNSAIDLGKEAMNKMSSGKEDLLKYVGENPLKSLGIAFIAGIILAKWKK